MTILPPKDIEKLEALAEASAKAEADHGPFIQGFHQDVQAFKDGVSGREVLALIAMAKRTADLQEWQEDAVRRCARDRCAERIRNLSETLERAEKTEAERDRYREMVVRLAKDLRDTADGLQGSDRHVARYIRIRNLLADLDIAALLEEEGRHAQP